MLNSLSIVLSKKKKNGDLGEEHLRGCSLFHNIGRMSKKSRTLRSLTERIIKRDNQEMPLWDYRG